MNWLTKFLKSSIGKKLLMALTGLFLCTFLIVHLIGNFQLFKNDGGYAFNVYADFMTSNPLIKTVSYGLYAIILFHAIWGLYLVTENKKARPVAYQIPGGNASSAWSSRSMGILGTIILAFIALHMSGFWAQYHFGEIGYTQYERDMITNELQFHKLENSIAKNKEVFVVNTYEYTIVKDLYSTVEAAFKVWWVVLIYLISMAAIAFHLIHGFKSAFQTLGVNHSKYNGLIQFIGVGVFGIIIPILFAAMPVYFFIK